MMRGLLFLLAGAAAAIGLVAVAGAQEGGDSPSRWRYFERVDSMTDAREPSTHTSAVSGDATFIFTCNGPERTLSFQYLPRRYMRSRPGEVMLRVDGGAALSMVWEYQYRGAFIANERRVYEIARALADGRRLVVRGFTHEDQPVDATFNIDGARAQFDAVLAACNRAPLETPQARHGGSTK